MLSVEHISAGSGSRLIVDDVSAVVQPGEVHGLVGPSGAGKTTLLRCIVGLQQVTRGRIKIGGRDVTECPISERRIAFMQQAFALYDQLSILENVLVAHGGLRAPKPIQASARNLLELVGIEERAFDRPPRTLSGGEAQRVALCKALMKDATVFLLDEPFSNLDKRRRRELGMFIRQRARKLGLSVVIVSHDEMDILFFSDRVSIVQDGRIIQTGTLEELHSRPKQEQAASFGVEAGLQAVLTNDIDAQMRAKLNRANPAFIQSHFVAWRPDRSVLKDGVTDIVFDDFLVLRVTPVRAMGGTGGAFMEMATGAAREPDIIWHFQPAQAKREVSDLQSPILCVRYTDLVALDSKGQVLS